jgi:hypothetical protein
MKRNLALLAFAILAFSGCEKQVTVNPPSSPEQPAQQPGKVIEKDTTVVNPPVKEEKKVENNTTIVNEPAKPAVEEKKTTTTTTSQ